MTPAPREPIYIHPGETYFGRAPARVTTILGSCVAITLWHPALLIGGICHYMLPTRHNTAMRSLDGRYADEAIAILLNAITRAKTAPTDYVAKMVGASTTLFSNDNVSRTIAIGAQNIRIGKELLARHGFHIKGEQLGGSGHRKLLFDLRSGDVLVKHTQPAAPTRAAALLYPLPGAPPSAQQLSDAGKTTGTDTNAAGSKTVKI